MALTTPGPSKALESALRPRAVTSVWTVRLWTAMGLFSRVPIRVEVVRGAKKPKKAKTEEPAAPAEPKPKPKESPKKTESPKTRDSTSRIATVPLGTVHYQFSAKVSAEKRLRNRAAEGDAEEVRRLIGAGADINSTNEVSTRAADPPTFFFCRSAERRCASRVAGRALGTALRGGGGQTQGA